MKKLFLALLAIIVSLGILGLPQVARADNNTVKVTNPSQVPAGAVKTGETKDKCATTTTWTLTVPGTAAETVTKYKFLREIPAVAEESHKEYCLKHRTREFIPGTAEESHQEWGVEKRTREYVEGEEAKIHEEYKYQREVKDCKPTYKTEYQWEKHVKGNKEKKDKDGKWVADGGFGWRDYPGAGPVWADGGSGPHHSTWTEGNYRYTSTDYKYVKTGVTREVKTGEDCTTRTEYSGWVLEQPSGDGWEKTDTRTVTDTPASEGHWSEWSNWETTESGLREEPNVPADTDTKQYRKTGPEKVVDKEATEDSYSDWSDWSKVECGLLVEPTPPADTATEEWKVTDKTVITVEAKDGYTEYYVEGGEPSRDRSEASWVLSETLEGWTQFKSKTFTIKEATPDVVTHYVYNDEKVCVVPPPEKPTPEPTKTPAPDKPKPVVKKMEVKKATPKPVETVAAPETVTDEPTLAQTGGSNAMKIALVVGLIVLIAGAAALVASRRK